MNHQIIYQLQDVFNLLPEINLPEFVKATYVKTNDQGLVIYLASMTRLIIALHNLLTNKIANKETLLFCLFWVLLHLIKDRHNIIEKNRRI